MGQPTDEKTAEEVLAEWLERYRRLIHHVVRLYSFDRARGEDLYQEIALALWRSIPSFEGRSDESTWIYRVALNTAISSARRHPDPSISQDSVDELAGADTHETLDRSSELEWLYGQIRTMSLIDRSLVLLYLDGNSYQEISAILGISESNVGAKLNRLKARLKNLAEEN